MDNCICAARTCQTRTTDSELQTLIYPSTFDKPSLFMDFQQVKYAEMNIRKMSSSQSGYTNIEKRVLYLDSGGTWPSCDASSPGG